MRGYSVEAEVEIAMVTMTCSDDSDVRFALQAADPPRKKEPEWTPAMARIMRKIIQALEAFPEAHAARQAAFARARHEERQRDHTGAT